MKFLLPLCLTLSIIGAASPTARAQQVVPPRAPLPSGNVAAAVSEEPGRSSLVRPRPASYRGEIAVVDLLSVGLILLGAGLESPAVAFSGLGLYAAGPAYVHAVIHERSPAVWGSSFLMRTVFPIAGGFIGYKLDMMDCEGDFLCGISGLGAGMLSGTLAAMVIDNALLAAPSAEADAPRQFVSRPAAVTAVAPTPIRGGVSLTMHGRF